MRAAAHQVHTLRATEPIARAEMHHLAHIMRKIEGGPIANRIFILPTLRREDFLIPNAAFDIRQANRLQPVQRKAPIARFFRRPIRPAQQIRHRHQHIQCGMPGRCHGRIGTGRGLHIKRRVLRNNPSFDLREVILIIFCKQHGVMRQIKRSFNAQIKHEGGTGIPRFGDFLIGPLRALFFFHQARNGMGEIRIHHHRIHRMKPPARFNAHSAPAFKDNAINLGVQADIHAHTLGNPRHGFGHNTAPAARMKHAMFIFQEGQDGEHARAAEGTHAQVFGLEGKSQARARVREMPL